MNQPLALVIDDEPDICELLTLTLARMDVRTETAMNIADAKALLGIRPFDLCLLFPHHWAFLAMRRVFEMARPVGVKRHRPPVACDVIADHRHVRHPSCRRGKTAASLGWSRRRSS